MILCRVGHILPKPLRRLIGMSGFFVWEFHLCQEKTFVRGFEYVQFDGQAVLLGDHIADLGDHDYVCFG